MKLLIIGANGQLGSELARQVRSTDFQPVLTDCYRLDNADPISVLDITDPASIERIFREWGKGDVLQIISFLIFTNQSFQRVNR